MATSAANKEQNGEPLHYAFTLFVVNGRANSRRARENLARLCDRWLPERHQIKVVDVLEDFQTALDFNILVTPAVVVTDPEPRITIHGDLSDAGKFVEALNLNDYEDDES